MRNNLFRDTALLVAAVLLSTSFWSCSKDEEPVPEPTPPVVSVTGVTLNKTGITLEVDGSETLTATVAPDNATNKKVTWKSDKPKSPPWMPQVRLQAKNKINKVCVYGHSLNDIDMPYLIEVRKNILSIPWTVSYYENDDQMKFKTKLHEKLGIPNHLTKMFKLEDK